MRAYLKPALVGMLFAGLAASGFAQEVAEQAESNHLSAFLGQIVAQVGQFIPRLFLGLLVLVVGWLIALFVGKIFGSALAATNLDSRAARTIYGEKSEHQVQASYWISQLIYYFLLIIVLVAFFEVVGFEMVTSPMRDMLAEVFSYLPKFLAAVLILILAWAAATTLRLIAVVGCDAFKLDLRVATELEVEDEKSVPVSKTVGDSVYWLTFLFFLPVILFQLGMTGLTEPMEDMIKKVLHYLPNVFLAGIILLIGWFFARAVQKLTSNLLASLGLDRISARAGIKKLMGERRLSEAIAVIVYIWMLLNVLVVALEVLGIQTITQPFLVILGKIHAAVPNLFAAGAVMIIAYIVGRIIADMLKNILTSVGTNTFLARLGIGKEPVEGDVTLSDALSRLALFFIMFFAGVEACKFLGFLTLVELGYEFLVFAGHVALGVAIFLVGVWLSKLAAMAIESSKSESGGKILALITRIVILVFAGAIALEQVVPSNGIVIWGFIIAGGAIAVAASIAFGVGGIKIAERKIEEWVKRLESDKKDS